MYFAQLDLKIYYIYDKRKNNVVLSEEDLSYLKSLKENLNILKNALCQPDSVTLRKESFNDMYFTKSISAFAEAMLIDK